MKVPLNNNNPAGVKANTKLDMNGKCKGTDSSSGRIPKKKRTEKHCVLCKDKGGKHDTHNTNRCAKWEKEVLSSPRGSRKVILPTGNRKAGRSLS